ncbi:glyceraldehyde 3-phosphate dehydrogenase [Paenisporosarcina quisquiliarum]|uniref:Glyceraldehyde-3-phosphate dehydrogenase n=1 Tax=Psychrobacillus psychrodurans TaxID=126157 RepID=A0A9X3L8W1_9BACI|nr:type I glyceraldehyde-3-phosphate dehydrogenase [Psychrobacillus psychrodurans]SEN15617.1 glyceraldehyde 3-phosphate dehydrogenase [Paenisporosarcina quisquiliarum]MCK1998298.1 type I glyceraldehyde-3-phosphate dehydrogenase [Psychrobacillus psychrodurans]MCZ8533389.1 type I glyceraldehyde-3-phosphate dehydrogenase [Psychrobacillus psychrodurans]MCZ8540264.1 type I glyceraldehyde-3-phosphate dehydrogenase [Psychrobacillus psychrodurans]SFM61811.1 glyceraldehyde 3-phosphate dehydrogenase [Ps
MTVKLAINGFGRIGRKVFREALEQTEIEVVAINDLTDAAMLAHLLKYDSVHGIFNAEVSSEGDYLVVNGKNIRVFAEKDPAALPWKEQQVDIVIECTGIFSTTDKASKHIEAGAKKVILSQPAKDDMPTFVMGVNADQYNPATDHVISNASCTTNCLSPIAKVLQDQFGIKRGMMTTIHSYTNDQRILDLPHSDYRRARAAAESMIPTTTGAAAAVAKVLPELKGKLDGMAVRVPTPNVSIVDFVAELDKNVTVEELNAALKQASDNELKGILDYNELPLVSRDYNGNTASSTVDGLSTMVLEDNLVKVLAWYDNESGYSARCIDLALLMANKGL